MIQILEWNHYRLQLPVPLDVLVQIPLADIPCFHFQKTRVEIANCFSENCLVVHSISTSFWLAFSTEKKYDILILLSNPSPVPVRTLKKELVTRGLPRTKVTLLS